MNEWYREYLPVDEYLGQELGGVIERRGNGNGEGGEFDRVIYVGDGSNDFCPLLSLKRSPLPFLSFHFQMGLLKLRLIQYRLRAR